jgi:hypothetical protein
MEQLYTNALDSWRHAYFQFILDHLDYSWDWFALSENPNITLETVLQHPELPWDWYGLSMNPTVATWKIVQQHPDLPWNWTGLSRNPDVATWEIVQQHPDLEWNWNALTSNPNITLDLAIDHPEYPWDWDLFDGVSKFDFYRFDKDEYDLCTYSDLPTLIETIEIGQDVWGIYENPNLDWGILQHYPNHPWNWSQLSDNPMTLAREAYIQRYLAKHIPEWFIKSDVKRELMEKMWHPRNMEKWSGWGQEEVEEK